MKEIHGNLWDFHGGPRLRFTEGHGWVCITTNGDINNHGAAVMGRGVAKEAATRFPRLPFELGDKLQQIGNHVHSFALLQLITFPVKHHWQEQADPELISRSVVELVYVVEILKIKSVYLPCPGCGNGRLKWEDVRPATCRARRPIHRCGDQTHMNTLAIAVGTYMLLAFAGGALLGWIAGSARVPKTKLTIEESPSPGPTPYDLEEMVNQAIDDVINDPEPELEPKPDSYTLSGIIRDPLTGRFVKRDTNNK